MASIPARSSPIFSRIRNNAAPSPARSLPSSATARATCPSTGSGPPANLTSSCASPRPKPTNHARTSSQTLLTVPAATSPLPKIAKPPPKARVVYTDVWVSMGMEEEAAQRERDFSGYQINEALVALANEDALVMHCLPAYRGKEIDEPTSKPTPTPSSGRKPLAPRRRF